MALVRGGLVSLVGCGLMLLGLMCGVRLLRLMGSMCLVARMALMLLKGLVCWMGLMCLVALMRLVGHDGITVHRLAHGLLAVHHGRRLLSRRCRALPGLDDGARDVALGRSSRAARDISVDAGLVEEVMGVVALRRLLGSVGLLLVWRRGVRDRRRLVLRRDMGWLEGSGASEANLGVGQASMGG